MIEAVGFVIAMFWPVLFPIVIGGILIIWFFILRIIINIFTHYLKANNYKKTIKFKKLIFLISYIIPFLPIFISAYQNENISNHKENTFPELCKDLSGYKPFNPVKLISIKNKFSAFEYLPLKGVEFTEWEMKGTIVDNLKSFGPGKYRLRFYDDGSEHCVLLASNAPKAIEEYLRYSKKYVEKGYELAKRDGLCLGIEKIDNFTAQYKIVTYAREKIMTKFGYSIYQKKYELIELKTNNIISQYTAIDTQYSRQKFSDYRMETIFLNCPQGNYGPLKKASFPSKKTGRFKMDEIIDGFFDLD